MSLDRLENKLDRVAEDVAYMRAQLTDHVKRTADLEANVKPLQENMQRLKGMAMLIGGGIGLIEILAKMWK